MKVRIFSGKLPTLLLMVAMFFSGYLLQYEITVQPLNKCLPEPVKIHKNQPVNNLTYPAFQHPLAPPYPFPYTFLVNQPDKCKNRKPFLVLMVFVKSNDEESRQTIRETWGNVSLYDVDVVRIFLVGLSQVTPKQNQLLLEEESRTFGDIIQQDFMDTYYNLTLKTLMGLEWVTKFCPSTSYVMKVDSDVFLNVDYLVHQLLHPDLPVRKNYFTGDIKGKTRPMRNRIYKWYVPREIYPNDTYPPYCTGPGYVFSVDMAQKIYDVAQEIQVIPMEDAFMGICLYNLQISPSKPPGGLFNIFKPKYDLCKFKKIVIAHHYAGKELRNVWKDFWANKTWKC
ncbi:beta-1,3-galactosyltransferase 2-like [Engystomops pustulosus]|uniref:beta-1,3-galactosyltransferase 2-like n=1 Tax=Engystomops pustulosus TaxID=76066 RepID=UPI003AFA7741